MTSTGATSPPRPTVVLRSGWGADESLRFDSRGLEIWPPASTPVQKLIVHHTATDNDDPDPIATIRSIYVTHALARGWGDIGYNFLVDEAGNVYEGRHGGDLPGTPARKGTGGVTGAHVHGFNSGTVGIGMLGSLGERTATPKAQEALELLLSWQAALHGIDPLDGSGLYRNPVNGNEAKVASIAAHRDLRPVRCPGDAFYAALPEVRARVARRLAAASGSRPERRPAVQCLGAP